MKQNLQVAYVVLNDRENYPNSIVELAETIVMYREEARDSVKEIRQKYLPVWKERLRFLSEKKSLGVRIRDRQRMASFHLREKYGKEVSHEFLVLWNKLRFTNGKCDVAYDLLRFSGALNIFNHDESEIHSLVVALRKGAKNFPPEKIELYNKFHLNIVSDGMFLEIVSFRLMKTLYKQTQACYNLHIN